MRDRVTPDRNSFAFGPPKLDPLELERRISDVEENTGVQGADGEQGPVGPAGADFQPMYGTVKTFNALDNIAVVTDGSTSVSAINYTGFYLFPGDKVYVSTYGTPSIIGLNAQFNTAQFTEPIERIGGFPGDYLPIWTATTSNPFDSRIFGMDTNGFYCIEAMNPNVKSWTADITNVGFGTEQGYLDKVYVSPDNNSAYVLMPAPNRTISIYNGDGTLYATETTTTTDSFILAKILFSSGGSNGVWLWHTLIETDSITSTGSDITLAVNYTGDKVAVAMATNDTAGYIAVGGTIFSILSGNRSLIMFDVDATTGIPDNISISTTGVTSKLRILSFNCSNNNWSIALDGIDDEFEENLGFAGGTINLRRLTLIKVNSDFTTLLKQANTTYLASTYGTPQFSADIDRDGMVSTLMRIPGSTSQDVGYTIGGMQCIAPALLSATNFYTSSLAMIVLNADFLGSHKHISEALNPSSTGREVFVKRKNKSTYVYGRGNMVDSFYEDYGQGVSLYYNYATIGKYQFPYIEFSNLDRGVIFVGKWSDSNRGSPWDWVSWCFYAEYPGNNGSVTIPSSTAGKGIVVLPNESCFVNIGAVTSAASPDSSVFFSTEGFVLPEDTTSSYGVGRWIVPISGGFGEWGALTITTTS